MLLTPQELLLYEKTFFLCENLLAVKLIKYYFKSKNVYNLCHKQHNSFNLYIFYQVQVLVFLIGEDNLFFKNEDILNSLLIRISTGFKFNSFSYIKIYISVFREQIWQLLEQQVRHIVHTVEDVDNLASYETEKTCQVISSLLSSGNLYNFPDCTLHEY